MLNMFYLYISNGTDFDPYKTYGDLSKKGMYRPIGINRNDFYQLFN